MSNDGVIEAIRVRAYLLWEEAGCPQGSDLTFWDEARKQVEREREQAASLASEG